MSGLRLSIVLVVCVLAPLPSSVRAATPKQVDDAIKRGVEFLFAEQKDGNWEHLPQRDRTNTRAFSYDGPSWGMPTATATYGLLSAGVSAQDEHVKSAVAFLRKAELIQTYALCMRAQCWAMLPRTEENKLAIRHDLNQLLDGALTGRANRGLFDTYCPPKNRSQLLLEGSAYGTLGLSALEDAGAEVPSKFWTSADKTWRAQQNTDGGWSYGAAGNPSVEAGSGAGVTALFLTEKYLRQTALTNGNLHDVAREKGLEHVSHVTLDEHTELHWMYLIQRIAAASALKRFGDMDWYETMGNVLVKLQAKDGSWLDVIDHIDQPGNKAVGTGYCLAMLANGRAPLVMNKLKYTETTKDNRKEEAQWNERPRDAANVSEWIGRQRERTVNWQIVDIRAPVVDLLEAPILYIGGKKPLAFSDAEVDHLRDYLNAGGLIVGNADGGSKEFGTSFTKLGQKLLLTYEFRALPADHVILKGEQFPLDPKLVHAQGLSNGVRELMILIPDDYGRSWQMNEPVSRKPDYPFMANLFGYAVETSNVRYKGDTFLVNPDPSATVTKHLALARIQYNGNWNPEPGGWDRLTTILRNTQHAELTVQAVKPAELSAQKFPFAHITATQEFKLSAAERADIKRYVSDGGTLLVDAAGGRDVAATSLSNELTSMLGSAGDVLPITDAIYSRPVDLARIAYRRMTALKRGTPRLRAIKVEGRNAVFFSAEDLSLGLVGEPVDGVVGYEPESAAGLVTNLLLQK